MFDIYDFNLIISLSGSRITQLGIFGANRTEDLLVARNEIVSMPNLYLAESLTLVLPLAV